MANKDTPFGLRAISKRGASPYGGQVGYYYMPSTDTTAAAYVGTPVKAAGGADADGVPTVTVASSTDTVVGVICAVEPITRDSLRYRANSTSRYVWVWDDPDQEFEIQEVSGGTALTAAAAMLNANWTGSGGSTTTALSSIELNNATEATTTTLDFQLLGLVRRVDNAFGEHAKWRVRLNNHHFVDGTTGVS